MAAGLLSHPPISLGNIPPTISLRKLKKAINKFSNDERISEGGSAHVFRGTLKNGQIVSVKRLKPAADRDADYDREVGVLSCLSHPNIINLIGCCAYKNTERIIVYEFMPLRTLYDQLHGILWTEEEHRQFLLGLQKFGKGDLAWYIQKLCHSRTPTQVASHVQKYFIRQSNAIGKKKRSSLFDMVPDKWWSMELCGQLRW